MPIQLSSAPDYASRREYPWTLCGPSPIIEGFQKPTNSFPRFLDWLKTRSELAAICHFRVVESQGTSPLSFGPSAPLGLDDQNNDDARVHRLSSFASQLGSLFSATCSSCPLKNALKTQTRPCLFVPACAERSILCAHTRLQKECSTNAAVLTLSQNFTCVIILLP